MDDIKMKTLKDLKNALEIHGLNPEAINASVEEVMKAVGTKYMMELYSAVPTELIDQVQSMNKYEYTKKIHEAYFAKTGIQATDRLDQIISQTVEDMIERPGEYFQKKS